MPPHVVTMTESKVRESDLLPLELWDIVLSHVGCETRTLLDCSLVCRTWLPMARKYRFMAVNLFSKISPEMPPPNSPLLLCDPSSTILPYVRCIRLVEGLVPKSLVDRLTTNSPADMGKFGGLAWLDDILPTIRVDDLTALRYLDLLEIRWDELTAASRTSLKRLCRNVTMLQHFSSSTIQAGGSVLAVELLLASPSLRVFTFESSENSDGLNLAPPQRPLNVALYSNMPKVTPPLTRLSVKGHLGEVLAGLQLVCPKMPLEDLTLAKITQEDEGLAISFAQSCADTLTNLSLEYEKMDAPVYEPAICFNDGISGLTSLRAFTLKVHLQHIPSILRHIQSRDLKHLTLETSARTLSASDLDDLAHVLTTGVLATARPNVTIICFPLRDIRSDAAAMADMSNKLATSLKDLEKEGRLDILWPIPRPRV